MQIVHHLRGDHLQPLIDQLVFDVLRIEFADILFIAPWLLLLGVAMAGATAYATLRIRIRR